ncbi:MAG: hypothetical protein PHI28_10940 [Mangrovibacterium sp.]|nr:hypothetical protein [Mangrovibacterium sp.]
MEKNVCSKFISRRFRGSTVLEVIVSLTICLIIFSISTRFILKMQTGGNIRTKQRAELLLGRVMTSYADSAGFLYRDGNLVPEADTLPDETYPELRRVTLTVRLTGGRTIRQTSFYIRKEKQETP